MLIDTNKIYMGDFKDMLPGIGSALSLAGNYANMMNTNMTNAMSMKFSNEMYARSRRDALADRAFENDYNSPAAQMKRLKEAGINPNLPFSGGGSQSGGSSSPTRSSQAPGAKLEVPTINPYGAVAAYLDLKAKDQAIQNAQWTEHNLSADNESKSIANEINSLKLENYKKYSVEEIETRLNNMNARTTEVLTREEIERAMKEPNLAKAAQSVINMRQQVATSQAQKDVLEQQKQKIAQDINIRKLDEALSNWGANSQGVGAKVLGWVLQFIKGR